MRKISWKNAKTSELLERLQGFTLRGEQLLEGISASNVDGCGKIQLKNQEKSLEVDCDLSSLIAPLGTAGRTFLKHGAFDRVRDDLRALWKFESEPMFVMNTFSDEEDGDEVLSLNRITDEDNPLIIRRSFESLDINKVADLSDLVRIGSNGRITEMNFLSTDRTLSVEDGDDLIAGIFILFNERMVEAAPGLIRLVCSNGLTNTIREYSSSNLGSVFNEDTMRSAVDLTQWLKTMRGQKVKSLREVASAFTNILTKGFLNRFWKKWGLLIDTGSLDWYEVIADITESANSVLTPMRYQKLDIQGHISRVLEEKCCPTCSAGV